MGQLAKVEPCPYKAPVAQEQDMKRTRKKHANPRSRSVPSGFGEVKLRPVPARTTPRYSPDLDPELHGLPVGIP
jgi:hypothetical protein